MMEMSLKEAFQLQRYKYYHKSENSYIIDKDKEYFCRVKTEEDARRLTHHLKKIGFEKKNLEKALEETGIKKCNGGTNTGFYRTSRIRNPNYKSGYVYTYQYYNDDGKRVIIKSIDLSKLRKKVLEKGLVWYAETDEAKDLEENF